MRNCVYRRIKIRKRMNLYIPAFFFTFIFIGYAKAQPRENDFGIWLCANIEKKIDDKWSVGSSTELHTMNNTKSIDRWQAGINGSRKILSTFKLDAGYEIQLKNHNVKELSEKVVRHRITSDITKRWRISHFLKLSLRERYQYTHMVAKNGIDASDNHHLRSRFKAEMGEQEMRWQPFVSVEVYNDMAEQFTVDELRATTGVGLKINRQQIVNIGYLLDLKESGGCLDKATHVFITRYIIKI